MSTTKSILIDSYVLKKDICNIKKETENIINDVYSRFKSEENENHRQYCIDKLENYIYVPKENKLWDGRNIRYIDTSNAFDMPLKLGGFLINDNGFVVTLKNNQRIFRVNKRGKYFFMNITSKDEFRDILKNVLR